MEGELVARGTNQVIRGLDVSAPTPSLREAEKGWSSSWSLLANDEISDACAMKPP